MPNKNLLNNSIFIIRFILPILLILLLYYLISEPALWGTFELDDHSNLDGLKDVYDFKSALRYAFSYFVHGTGRSISLLTFALQSNSWPLAHDFKLFNLLLHQINALLIFLLSFQLLKVHYTQSISYKLSLLILLLWIFAPINFFAVFYVVQRMTLLSTFFVLIGINVHIYMRLYLFKNTESFKAYLFLSLAFLTSLSFALLSKENGILICIYILIIEYFFINKAQTKYWHIWRSIFLYLPLILLCLYLIQSNKLNYSANLQYPFDAVSRLWNQAIIIWQYIYSILLPTNGSYGLVYDDIEVVQYLTDSSQAIIALLALFIIIISSWYFKTSLPFLFFGLMWFLGGHLLESTALKLELRFDHRNYLPSFGIIYLLVLASYQSLQKVTKPLLKYLVYLLIILYLYLYIDINHQLVHSWNSEKALANYQIKYHPKSLRAQSRYLIFLYNTGDYKNTALLMAKMEQEHPKKISLKLNRFLFSHLNPYIISPEKSDFLSIARNGNYDRAIDSVIVSLFQCIVDKACKKLTYSDFREIISNLQLNPKVKNSPIMALMAVLKSKSYSQEDNWQAAIEVLLEVPENRRKRIDFYFILLQNQYMAKDFKGARDTIKIIEDKLEKSPIVQQTLVGVLNNFKKHINDEYK